MNIEEIRQKALADVKKGLRKEFARRDALIIQAVSAMDDLDKTANLGAQRLREWYSLHFPELDRKIEDNKTYAEIAFLGDRKTIDDKTLKKLAGMSVGAELGEKDYKIITRFAAQIVELYNLRDAIDSYIGSMMRKISPNIDALAGSSIGARLISLAGGLENMARMPASTIQLLGAEKALFRHLKTKSKPPKYGIIFQCPFIHSADREKRGKIARALAGKLAIAAKIDFHNPHLDESLKKDFEKRLKQIG